MEATRIPSEDQRPARRRRGSIVGPLVLIGLGVLFLLQNYGLVPTSAWTTVLNLWPVLLILIGVELILGRGSWASAVVVGLLVLAIASTATYLNFFPATVGAFRTGPFVPVETVRMVEEIANVRQVSYELAYGAGNLSVSALPQSSENLLEADLERDERTTIDKSVDRQADRAKVTVRARDTRALNLPSQASGGGQWTARISPRTTTDMTVHAGLGDLDLDLGEIKLASLTLDAGVGDATVSLPKSAVRTSVKLNAGIGDVEIVVPRGVAAQVKVSTGIGAVRIDETRFVKVEKDLYRSVDYDSAANRIDLDLSAGVGSLTVR